MSTRALRTLALALGFAVVAAPASAQSFVVIVNTANPVKVMSVQQVSGLFLKKDRWANSRATAPVDLARSSPVRADFTRMVHNRTVDAVTNYWSQQMFAGKGFPPPEKSTDDQVVEYVRRNPGAIGYVSFTAKIGSGVRVVDITE